MSRGLRRTETEYDEYRRSKAGYVDTYAVPEADVLQAVLEALRAHPKVAAVWRMNVAKGRLQYPDGGASRWISFGFPGASDIMGFLCGGGCFFACECKRAGAKLTDDQQAFLDAVNAAGGLGFCARSVNDVFAAIPLG